MLVEVELVFGFTYSGWLHASRGGGEEEGFAVTFSLDAGVQAGSLAAVFCPGVLGIGLTMAVWSPCLGKCPLWGRGELGALQGVQSIQHRQRGAGQEVGCIAVDALLPRPAVDACGHGSGHRGGGEQGCW